MSLFYLVLSIICPWYLGCTSLYTYKRTSFKHLICPGILISLRNRLPWCTTKVWSLNQSNKSPTSNKVTLFIWGLLKCTDTKIPISYTREDSNWWANGPVPWHHHDLYQACGLLLNWLVLSTRISVLFLYIQKEKMSLNALIILFLITDGNKNYNMTYELNKLFLLSRSN